MGEQAIEELPDDTQQETVLHFNVWFTSPDVQAEMLGRVKGIWNWRRNNLPLWLQTRICGDDLFDKTWQRMITSPTVQSPGHTLPHSKWVPYFLRAAHHCLDDAIRDEPSTLTLSGFEQSEHSPQCEYSQRLSDSLQHLASFITSTQLSIIRCKIANQRDCGRYRQTDIAKLLKMTDQQVSRELTLAREKILVAIYETGESFQTLRSLLRGFLRLLEE